MFPRLVSMDTGQTVLDVDSFSTSWFEMSDSAKPDVAPPLHFSSHPKAAAKSLSRRAHGRLVGAD
jgi:hypothetical protein